ncbi:hypothetical protein [Corynebacterium lubricantis]|uniref:hypothetical protein n=1 Tax=Corynebacterium lubricantis TaxID=541095 RepID=UPI00035D038C|nr:hypothetical protein [Corynebacterium lubricantis]
MNDSVYLDVFVTPSSLDSQTLRELHRFTDVTIADLYDRALAREPVFTTQLFNDEWYAGTSQRLLQLVESLSTRGVGYHLEVGPVTLSLETLRRIIAAGKNTDQRILDQASPPSEFNWRINRGMEDPEVLAERARRLRVSMPELKTVRGQAQNELASSIAHVVEPAGFRREKAGLWVKSTPPRHGTQVGAFRVFDSRVEPHSFPGLL